MELFSRALWSAATHLSRAIAAAVFVRAGGNDINIGIITIEPPTDRGWLASQISRPV